MRPIKLRAWNKPKRKMVYLEEGQSLADFLTRNPESICEWLQFTGLKDKNGKEIYEGDILKDKLGSVALVTFSNGAFTLLMNTEELIKQIDNKRKEKKFERESFFRDYLEYNKWYDCEVIGNKFENPKLLGGVQNA